MEIDKKKKKIGKRDLNVCYETTMFSGITPVGKLFMSAECVTTT